MISSFFRNVRKFQNTLGRQFLHVFTTIHCSVSIILDEAHLFLDLSTAKLFIKLKRLQAIFTTVVVCYVMCSWQFKNKNVFYGLFN